MLGDAEATAGATPFAALLGAPMADEVPVDLERHVLVLPYSSGTSGLPKGVMLSHANLVANVAQVQAIQPVRPGERTLAVLPFFHIYGLLVLMSFFPASGGAVVTLPRFELETALRLVQEHRMRRLYLVPPIILALSKHPAVDRFDLTSLELILSGAAPLGADLEAACSARLGCEVVQGYGMTEMSPVSHFTPPGGRRAGSAGPIVPNTLCRIVDPETGVDCASGEVGELWVQGPQVMLGYLNKPEATAAALRDGWLRTGDLGRIDADSYLYVVDRVKELIKVKGFQVPPAELEALLVSHPDVADAAVVGLPDDEAGEVPMAFVVRAPGADPSPEDLQAFVAAHVAGYKQLRRLTFVEAIPKTPSGKILRRILRAGAIADAASQRAARHQRRADGAVVEIVELAADRHALGERGHRHAERGELVGDVMRRGLAVDRGVERQDHLARALRGGARHEFGDAQALGGHRVERREHAAEHMVAAAEGAAALHRPEVGDGLDDAELAVGAARVGADRAELAGRDVAAARALAHRRRHVGERRGQRLEQELAPPHHRQHRPPRRARPEARQPRHQRDQPVDRRVAGHAQNGSFIPGGSSRPSVTLAISACAAAIARACASWTAATIRSSTTSRSSGLNSDGSIVSRGHRALGGRRDLDEPGARFPGHLDRVEPVLHVRHPGLHLLRLLHDLGHVAKLPQPLQHSLLL